MPSPLEYVPMVVFKATAAELNKLRQNVSREDAERHVDDYARSGDIMPSARDWAIDLCLVSKRSLDDFAASVGPIVGPLASQWKGDGRQRPGGMFDMQETTVCVNPGISQDAFMKVRGDKEE